MGLFHKSNHGLVELPHPGYCHADCPKCKKQKACKRTFHSDMSPHQCSGCGHRFHDNGDSA